MIKMKDSMINDKHRAFITFVDVKLKTQSYSSNLINCFSHYDQGLYHMEDLYNHCRGERSCHNR